MELVLGVVLNLRLAFQVLQVLERIPAVAVVDKVLEKGGVVALDGFCDFGVGCVVVPRPFVVAVGVVVVSIVVISASQVREQSCEGLLEKERERKKKTLLSDTTIEQVSSKGCYQYSID